MRVGSGEHNNEEREKELYLLVRPGEAFNTFIKKLKLSKGYMNTEVKFGRMSGEPTGVNLRNYPVFTSWFSGMSQIAGW